MKTWLAIALVCAGPLLSCASGAAVPGVSGARSSRQAAERLTFVVEVDCVLARDQVWLLQQASDEKVVAVAANAVRRRLEAMQRDARVELVPDSRRFQVSLATTEARDRELVRGMLRSVGLCELFFVAEDATARARGIDLADERARLSAWRKTNADQPIELFTMLARSAGGPAPGLSWITAGTGAGGDNLGWPVLLPEHPEDQLGATSFARVYEATDASGEPALGYEPSAARSGDLARVTAEHVGQRLAIVLFGQLVSAPVLKAPVTSAGVLEGRFEKDQLARIARAIEELRSPLTVVSVR